MTYQCQKCGSVRDRASRFCPQCGYPSSSGTEVCGLSDLLRELLRTHPRLWQDRNKLSAFLADLAPGLKRERNILLRVCECQIPAKMQALQGNDKEPSVQVFQAVSRWKQSLTEEQGLSEEASLLGLYTWACALGATAVCEVLDSHFPGRCQTPKSGRRAELNSANAAGHSCGEAVKATKEAEPPTETMGREQELTAEQLHRMQVYFSQAQDYYCQQRYVEALEWLLPLCQRLAGLSGLSRFAWDKLVPPGEAQNMLGECLCNKGGELRVFQEALALFRQAADCGHVRALTNIGNLYYNGWLGQRDFHKALEYYKTAVRHKDIGAMVSVGLAYFTGSGVEKNPSLGVQWFRQAAQLGSMLGQYRLGYCYLFGTGVAKDYAQAVHWLRLSSQQEHWPAVALLGECYVSGWGVKASYQEAFKLFSQAALHNDPCGLRRLGDCYYGGYGISLDYQEAFRYYEKAARCGEVLAQYNTACCYQAGQGVAQDLKQARHWFIQAAHGGLEFAEQWLKDNPQ